MLLFYDTETTGFINEGKPVDHPSQPYLVQLAALLVRPDGRVIAGMSLIVDNGVEIPAAAAAVHGITTEAAASLGVSPATALSAFAHFYQRADLCVAHNMRFDKKVMEAAIARSYRRVKPLDKPSFCTMEAATPIINLPPTDRMKKAGFNKPKPPKLSECIKYFFDEALEGAHDALIDVAACKRVYFKIREIEDNGQDKAAVA